MFPWVDLIYWAVQIKYKEEYVKNKDKAIGMDVSDSKTMHSLQVTKLSSEVSLSTQSQVKFNTSVFLH